MRRTWMGLGAGVATALAGVAAYTARRISGPTPARCRDTTFVVTPFETNVDFETITLAASDGVQLSGWWLPRPESQQVVITCHGHRGKKSDLLGIGSGLWRAGYNVLAFDFRGRGDSSDSVCSLAYHEVADLRGAVAYVQARVPGARIGVVGYSMGAAVSLLAAAEEPAIAAVVADSSFAVMRAVVHRAVSSRRLPARAVVELADRWTGQRYGYRFSSVRPVEAIARLAPRPVLLIHGGADTLIGVEHSQQLLEAAQAPSELWVVEGATHCGAYFADRAGYVERVRSFFDHALAPAAATA